MTLIELLIATSLLAIVMIGAVAVEYAIRSSRSDVRRKANINSQVTTALYSLTNDAIQAIGSIADPGIIYNEGAGDVFQTLCFRTTYDIDDPSNNRWTCYSMDVNSVNADHILYRCDDLTDPLTPGTEGCNFPDDLPRKALLTSVSDDFFYVINDSDGNLDYIEFRLETRHDPASAEHVIKNPNTVVTSRVSPPGMTRK